MTRPIFYRKTETLVLSKSPLNRDTANFARKEGTQSIKFKMWVELLSNFCHLSNIIQPLLRTNSLYEKPTVVFSPHTPCRRVRLARFTLEDHAYFASQLPKTSENDCFAVCLRLERDSNQEDGY